MSEPTWIGAVRDLGSHHVDFDEDDAILYALAVGSGVGDLDLVDERRLVVLPTLALTWGLWAADRVGESGAFDPTVAVHAAQDLVVLEPLPRRGRVEMRGGVRAVWDKGTAAIIEVRVTSRYFEAVYSIYAPGEGGFGGSRGPASGPAALPAVVRRQEAVVETRSDQAALYRLTGDRHRIHIDPEAARAIGSDTPVLHGLCTLAVAVGGVAQAVGTRPTRLKRLRARFSGLVIPGDRIGLQVDELADGSTAFEATVGSRSVLRDGRATFVPDDLVPDDAVN